MLPGPAPRKAGRVRVLTRPVPYTAVDREGWTLNEQTANCGGCFHYFMIEDDGLMSPFFVMIVYIALLFQLIQSCRHSLSTLYDPSLIEIGTTTYSFGDQIKKCVVYR